MSSSELENVSILAVDDHRDSRDFLKIILERFGAKVTAVESGRLALEVIKRQPLDILVCDLAMPLMDGFQLLKEIRDLSGETSALPAIACTAFASNADSALTLRAGFQAHIAKPIQIDQLIATIRAVLHSAAKSKR